MRRRSDRRRNGFRSFCKIILQMGTLAAIVFPVILCVGLAYTKKVRNV